MLALLSTAEADGKTVPGAVMEARWVGLPAAKSFERVEFGWLELDADADGWLVAASTDRVFGKELEALTEGWGASAVPAGLVAGLSALLSPLLPAVFGEAGDALTFPFRKVPGDCDKADDGGVAAVCDVALCGGVDVWIAGGIRDEVDSATLGVDVSCGWGSDRRADEALKFGLASFERGDFGLANGDFLARGSIVDFSRIGGREPEASAELSTVADSAASCCCATSFWATSSCAKSASELVDAGGAAVESRTA